MSWLLELLLEGIKELCSQFIVDMMEIVTDMFTELLSCDLGLFEELFGVVADLYKNVMVPMGIAILLLICVWQLFKSMFGKAGLVSEDPIELVCRSGICLFLVVAARPVVNYILNVAGTPYQWVTGTEIKVESFSEYVSVLEGVTGGLGIDSLSVALLMLIMQIVVAWNYFKMLFVIAERYVLLGVFSYTSPLAFATGGSKATNNILASWSKMFGGQIVLIILNSWCLKMFLSGYGNLMASSYGFTKFFVATLCLIGFCKVTFKLDSYMSSLGVNLGRPSSGIGAMGLMMAAGRVFSHVGRGSSAATDAGESGNGSGGQTYGTATNMTEGAAGPIPMAADMMAGENMDMDTATDADAFGSVSEGDTQADMQQEDFSGMASEDAGVLDELGAMPADEMETSDMGMNVDAADANMSVDAGEMTDFSDSIQTDGDSDTFQPDMAGNEMANTGIPNTGVSNADIVMGSDSNAFGDYPVEEDYEPDGAGPEMDLDGGNIDGTGVESEAGADGMASAYGDSASSGEHSSGGTTGQSDAGIISEINGDSMAGAMESYSSGEGIHAEGGATDVSSSTRGNMDMHTGAAGMKDVGLYHDFDDDGKGTLPNLDAGNVPPPPQSEKELRNFGKEERFRAERSYHEVPKSREELRKRKGNTKKNDNNRNMD